MNNNRRIFNVMHVQDFIKVQVNALAKKDKHETKRIIMSLITVVCLAATVIAALVIT
jgi:hypothetical protein